MDPVTCSIRKGRLSSRIKLAFLLFYILNIGKGNHQHPRRLALERGREMPNVLVTLIHINLMRPSTNIRQLLCSLNTRCLPKPMVQHLHWLSPWPLTFLLWGNAIYVTMEMAANNSQFPDFSTIQMYHRLPHQSLYQLHLREAVQPVVPHSTVKESKEQREKMGRGGCRATPRCPGSFVLSGKSPMPEHWRIHSGTFS